MEPVLIVRHARTEGPGHLATFLDRHGIERRQIALDRGERLPVDAAGLTGLALMGGPMSANDPLPWVQPVLALIRDAVARGVPVLGHCLGGQLLARALGGRVGPNPVREIGWGRVDLEPDPLAREWFGERDHFLGFHWHGETFTLPPGAVPLARSRWCERQAFAIGPHLGLQCHIEMTARMVRVWTRGGARELREHAGDSVQAAPALLHDLEARVGGLNRLADRVYERWLAGVPPSMPRGAGRAADETPGARAAARARRTQSRKLSNCTG
jgi:GMP synthase-like glutamine amidotransferase